MSEDDVDAVTQIQRTIPDRFRCFYSNSRNVKRAFCIVDDTPSEEFTKLVVGASNCSELERNLQPQSVPQIARSSSVNPAPANDVDHFSQSASLHHFRRSNCLVSESNSVTNSVPCFYDISRRCETPMCCCVQGHHYLNSNDLLDPFDFFFSARR